MAIADDGFGLFSIRERLQRLGGSLKLESPKDGGLRVSLQLPLVNKTSDGENNDAQ